MVLPAGATVPMWGWARPEAGPVTIEYDGQEVQAALDAGTGRWDATLPARNATTEPCIIQIKSGKATRSLTDVLVGDVYMCVGASNIEFKLIDAADGELEVNSTINHSDRLRILTVDKASEASPQDDFTAKAPWQPVKP